MIIPKELLYPAPFYNFLNFISEFDLEGPLLDCGSGGSNPKQSLFVKLGFDIFGIEISEERFDMAQDFAKNNNLEFKMQLADMRDIPFESDHFAYVYSWNTIFHMNKKDIKKGVTEMLRVLKPGGLCFVNFLSKDSDRYGKGEEPNPGECVEIFDGEEVMHTYFDDDEPDILFENLNIEIIYKEKRESLRRYEDGLHKDCQFDYIVQKKRN